MVFIKEKTYYQEESRLRPRLSVGVIKKYFSGKRRFVKKN